MRRAIGLPVILVGSDGIEEYPLAAVPFQSSPGEIAGDWALDPWLANLDWAPKPYPERGIKQGQ